MPTPKTFLLPQGGIVTAPREEPPQPAFDAVPVAGWPGAPLQPIGNAMLAGVGPAASALRADTPDLTFEAGEHRVVPLRVATDHSIDAESPDPLTMEVVGADGVGGGIVPTSDRSGRDGDPLSGGDPCRRPLRAAAYAAGKAGHKDAAIVGQVILGAQFADVPVTAHPDHVTLREEDRIAAFYAGGNLFAEPAPAGAAAVNEHDYEPIPGLPAPLPPGESILWQGAPCWGAWPCARCGCVSSRSILPSLWHGGLGGLSSGTPARMSPCPPSGSARLRGLALALLALFAWLVARTTLYTITSRRVVMRFGIALPMTLQIPFGRIHSADLRSWADATGYISSASTLSAGERVPTWCLRPHTRPWKIARPLPTLRAVADATSVARILGRALAASAAQLAKSVAAAPPGRP